MTPWTALVTPLPPNSEPPSLSSTASNAPVEAPLGTPASATVPSSSATSTSRVGFPRESRICLAWIASMEATAGSLPVIVLPARYGPDHEFSPRSLMESPDPAWRARRARRESGRPAAGGDGRSIRLLGSLVAVAR